MSSRSSTYNYRGLFLLHFDPPYEHARHYLGYAKNDIRGYAMRVIRQQTFAPQALVEAALAAGCEVTLAKVYPGRNRDDRRRMRAQGSLSRFCPICIDEGTNHR